MFQDGSNKTILSSSLSQEGAPVTRALPTGCPAGGAQVLGTLQPDTQDSVQCRVLPKASGSPWQAFQPSGVFLDSGLTLTPKARGHHARPGQQPRQPLRCRQSDPLSTQQSRQETLVPFASLSAISGTFNSLFKVLFTFPSWYLFAIGLEPIFSFR